MKYLIAFLMINLLLNGTLQAQSKAEQEVTALMETFRKALVNPDKAVLEKLVSEELSFGHSGGAVEGKASMIDKLVSGRTDWLNVNFNEQTVQIIKNMAIVRHKYEGQLKSGESFEPINMRVLLVWVKQKGQWQLVARQAVKI